MKRLPLAHSLEEIGALGRKRRTLRVLGDGYTVKFTTRAANRKLGPMPVSMTDMRSCPLSCPLRNRGCYAEHGHTFMHWMRVPAQGVPWSVFCEQIAALPVGAIWRHNEAGDLPGTGESLDVDALEDLVRANAGRFGFTYTHRLLLTETEREAVRAANTAGFTVNLSANGLHDVDRFVALRVGPVVVNLPHDQPVPRETPAGHRIVLCPAEATFPAEDGTPSITCLDCKLCAKPRRKSIIAFLTHGSAKNFAAMVARASCGTGPAAAASVDAPETER